MPVNKISGGQQNANPHFIVSLPPGGTFVMPPGQGGAVGTFGNLATPQIGVGQNLTGQYMVHLGKHTHYQTYDPALQYWRTMNDNMGGMFFVSADGVNQRLANTTGCPIAALITNAGSGLTNGFNTVTVTPSAGGSVWSTIVGGAINTTVTITAGGTLYTSAPQLVFVPPASQGNTPYLLPTATCTISAGAINAVTVVNQGAGLVAVPTIKVIPQPGDTTGSGGILTVNATLAGSGTLLLMYPAGNTSATSGTIQTAAYGSAQTSVPTFTFSPASTIAATAIMNFTITGFTATTSGGGYGTGPGGIITGGVVAGTAANTNPSMDKGISTPIYPPINVANTTAIPTLASGFGGVNIQAIPTYTGIPNSTTGATTVAVQPPTVGGTNSTTFITSV